MDFVKDNNPVDFNFLLNMLSESLESLQQEKQASNEDQGVITNEFGYADPINKSLPIDSPENAVKSKLYFEVYKDDPKRLSEKTANLAKSRIDKCTEFFPETKNDFQLIEEISDGLALQKQASQKPSFCIEQYALNFEKDGSMHVGYSLNDFEDVVDSASRLGNDKHKMPLDWFIKTAQNLFEAAQQFEVPENLIPINVKAVGVKKEATADYADASLNLRVNSVNDDETVELYNDLFKSAKEMVNDTENLDQYVALIEDLDRTVGIDYNSGVPSPYQTFYSGIETRELEKLANSTMFIKEAAIPAEAFYSIDENKFLGRFSKNTAKQLLDLQQESKEKTASALTNVNNQIAELGDDIQYELCELIADESA